jgi:hypothetical protein
MKRSPIVEGRGRKVEIRNPKSEIRRKTENRNPKAEIACPSEIGSALDAAGYSVSRGNRTEQGTGCDPRTPRFFQIWDFGFPSDLGFRISDFPPGFVSGPWGVA